MSEKMEPIKSLASEANNYSLEDKMATSYIYNAEKSVWEVKEIFNRISAEIGKYGV